MDITSKEFAVEFCKTVGLSEDRWGDINDILCDAYFEGQREGIRKGKILGEDSAIERFASRSYTSTRKGAR